MYTRMLSARRSWLRCCNVRRWDLLPQIAILWNYHWCRHTSCCGNLTIRDHNDFESAYRPSDYQFCLHALLLELFFVEFEFSLFGAIAYLGHDHYSSLHWHTTDYSAPHDDSAPERAKSACNSDCTNFAGTYLELYDQRVSGPRHIAVRRRSCHG